MEPINTTEIITSQEFQKLAIEWAQLDDNYDRLFQEFLNNPHVKREEELSQFKAMQTRLYAIEHELYKVAEGIMTIQD